MNNTITTKAKEWGNSISAIINSKVFKRQKINPKDKLIVPIQKGDNIHSLRGTFPKKHSTQEIVNENKKG